MAKIAFEDFWQAYPHPTHRGSKRKAEERWFKFSETRKQEIMRSLEGYKNYIALTPWYTPKMAEGYINPKNELWVQWLPAETESHSSDETLQSFAASMRKWAAKGQLPWFMDTPNAHKLAKECVERAFVSEELARKCGYRF